MQRGWNGSSEFIRVVDLIRVRAEELEVIPVTSHERLVLSKCSNYPDFFDNQHLVVYPGSNGSVVVEEWGPGASEPTPTRLSYDDAPQFICQALERLPCPQTAV